MTVLQVAGLVQEVLLYAGASSSIGLAVLSVLVAVKGLRWLRRSV